MPILLGNDEKNHQDVWEGWSDRQSLAAFSVTTTL